MEILAQLIEWIKSVRELIINFINGFAKGWGFEDETL